MYVWAWDKDESQQELKWPTLKLTSRKMPVCSVLCSPLQGCPEWNELVRGGGRLSSRSPWLLWITKPSCSFPWHPYPCTFSVLFHCPHHHHHPSALVKTLQTYFNHFKGLWYVTINNWHKELQALKSVSSPSGQILITALLIRIPWLSFLHPTLNLFLLLCSVSTHTDIHNYTCAFAPPPFQGHNTHPHTQQTHTLIFTYLCIH